MKVTFEIPAEYEKEWNKDRFAESFLRLRADCHAMAGNYEMETLEMLTVAFHNAQVEEDDNPFATTLQIDLLDYRKMLLEKCEELIDDSTLAEALYSKLVETEDDMRFKKV